MNPGFGKYTQLEFYFETESKQHPAGNKMEQEVNPLPFNPNSLVAKAPSEGAGILGSKPFLLKQGLDLLSTLPTDH